jgi:hypothetical protein
MAGDAATTAFQFCTGMSNVCLVFIVISLFVSPVCLFPFHFALSKIVSATFFLLFILSPYLYSVFSSHAQSVGELQYWATSDPLNRVANIRFGGRYPRSLIPSIVPDEDFLIDFIAARNNQNYGVASQVIIHLSGQGDNVFDTFFESCKSGECFSNVSTDCVGCTGLFYANDAIRPMQDECGVCGGENAACVVCYLA